MQPQKEKCDQAVKTTNKRLMNNTSMNCDQKRNLKTKKADASMH